MTLDPSFSRRALLGAAASTATLAVASPFVARRADAQATSGTVNIFAWAGYLSEDMLAAFEKATGIKPVYTPYGTNDELLNQLRATDGAGFDIIWPSVDRVPNYVEFGLVQPIDETKVEWDRAIAIAKERGRAILLCHARRETRKGLLELLPQLRREGIRPVTVEELLEEH